MKYIIYYILAFTAALMLFSCKGKSAEKFNKAKWIEQVDPLFPPEKRSLMLDDLLKNYKLEGLTYRQLIDILGIPDSKDDTSLSYKIVVDYGKDIDPVYTKNLDFTFSKDSIIKSFKLSEWKKP
ncbi:MAG TPA: hypothetical protein VG890_08625 [Puia sp.]|nr:hypothetical protein [Puia sp.]